MRFARTTPVLRIGILPSGRPQWKDKNGKADFVARLNAVNNTLHSGVNLKEDALFPPETVLSADPTDPDSLMTVQWYARSGGISLLDIILPASIEECASRFVDTDGREDFLRAIRCAWAVTVAPDGDVAACIRSRASIVADLGGRKDDEP